MTRYTANALGKMHGIAPGNLRKSFARHGIKPDSNGKYTEADYLRAKQMGAAMDKSKVAEQAERVADQINSSLPSPATLTYAKLQRQIKRLDIEIQMAQVELDEALGKVVSVEKYKDQVRAVVQLMLTWWDQAADGASTKIKDATVMGALREARDRASRDILDIT